MPSAAAYNLELGRVAEFAHVCLRRILSLYSSLPKSSRPKSVVLVGHSMVCVIDSSIQTHTRALRKEKYASKIKSSQETQQTQDNYASRKQNCASHATDASGPCARKRNDKIDSIFHASVCVACDACI